MIFNSPKPSALDPIFGLMDTCRKDPNPNKIDLTVGVYKSELGQTPVMEAVKKAERSIWEEEQSKAYISMHGNQGFNIASQALVYGQEHKALKENRVCTVQTPGGVAAMRVAADVVKLYNPGATIWLSNPVWANHPPVFKSAGLMICEYPYYDKNLHGVDFDKLMSALEKAKPGDAVLLQASCHNPSGADLTEEQWQTLTDFIANKDLLPILDLAYQGFAIDLDADAYAIRLMAARLPELIITSIFSKNFGIYRDRAAIVSIVTEKSEQVGTLSKQLIQVIRGIYSMPPDHGAAIVNKILNNTELKKLWEQELSSMCARINQLRHLFTEKLSQKCGHHDFDFINKQYGMFSFLDLNQDQIHRLRKEWSVYLSDSSRISIPGISHKNIDYLTNAIASVL